MNLENLLWLVVISLALLAAFQMIYLLALNVSGNALRRKPKVPKMPIMPTIPQGGVTSAPPNATAVRVGGGKMMILSGLLGSPEIAFPASSFSIGRFYSPEGNVLVALDEKSISRRHANFEGDDASRQYYLSDNESSYGTYIQRENRMVRLTPRQRERLYNEDVVQFGNEVLVRFVLPTDKRDGR